MTRALYVDCFSGASGDMLLGALVDVGVDPGELRHGLDSLGLAGWSLAAERVQRHGITGTWVRVTVDPRTEQPHRRLSDIQTALAASDALPGSVKDRAREVFERLAEVEATIHGTSVEEVEFHEVGAVDSIVDTVGVVLGLYLLGLPLTESSLPLYCSGLPMGSGWVRSAHGRLPVPAPATVELLRRAHAPTRRAPGDEETGELTTPTGAALLTTLAGSFKEPVFERIESVGYGFGTRQPAWPNAVRVLLGEVAAVSDLAADTVVELQTNLDDSTPEQLAFAMERLFEAGAVDVAFSPLQMKKNRPGVLLRVLAPPALRATMAERMLTHTSALGVRFQTLSRVIAQRSERMVETRWGTVRIKDKLVNGRRFPAPEYEDCAAAARSSGTPLGVVYAAALQAAGGDVDSD